MATQKPVLLVDDDPAFIDLYTKAFQENGIVFSTAFNAIEALDKAASEKPALILLDIMMPGLDGYEVLKRLKQNKETKNIPVWMITNLTEEMSKKQAVSLGAADYLVKSEHIPSEVCNKINLFLAKGK